MTGYYNASAGGNGPRADTPALLHDLGRRSVESSLEQALDRLAETLDRVDERDAETGQDGVPPEAVPLLEQLTGADDAPLTYRSLHRRVEQGRTSWDAFWRAPHEEADGLALVRDVMRLSREAVVETVTDLPEV